eukprot:TRINITY_DN24137_c0_g4_i1.p1 TRINITY_DN24137_c0_g4~~TRINITY_DN24137_c0_g4_i1.p1  ORF type:complete len:626 (-),score=65.83 TRINITY_DN24137_c0_g4_i1:202-2079(-)
MPASRDLLMSGFGGRRRHAGLSASSALSTPAQHGIKRRGKMPLLLSRWQTCFAQRQLIASAGGVAGGALVPVDGHGSVHASPPMLALGSVMQHPDGENFFETSLSHHLANSARENMEGMHRVDNYAREHMGGGIARSSHSEARACSRFPAYAGVGDVSQERQSQKRTRSLGDVQHVPGLDGRPVSRMDHRSNLFRHDARTPVLHPSQASPDADRQFPTFSTDMPGRPRPRSNLIQQHSFYGERARAPRFEAATSDQEGSLEPGCSAESRYDGEIAAEISHDALLSASPHSMMPASPDQQATAHQQHSNRRRTNQASRLERCMSGQEEHFESDDFVKAGENVATVRDAPVRALARAFGSPAPAHPRSRSRSPKRHSIRSRTTQMSRFEVALPGQGVRQQDRLDSDCFTDSDVDSAAAGERFKRRLRARSPPAGWPRKFQHCLSQSPPLPPGLRRRKQSSSALFSALLQSPGTPRGRAAEPCGRLARSCWLEEAPSLAADFFDSNPFRQTSTPSTAREETTSHPKKDAQPPRNMCLKPAAPSLEFFDGNPFAVQTATSTQPAADSRLRKSRTEDQFTERPCLSAMETVATRLAGLRKSRKVKRASKTPDAPEALQQVMPLPIEYHPP